MKQPVSFIVLLSLMLTLMLSSIYYFHKDTAPLTHDPNKIRILCTTSMITDTVKQIGGDCVEVHGLMGPGVDPHLYKAREGDVHRLAQTHIIFYNGLHLEGKMATILESMQQYTPSIALGKALDPKELITFDTGICDPHIWHDVQLWIQVVRTVSATLAEHDPKHSNYYQQNTNNYIAQLTDLNTWIQHHIDTIPEHQRILITAHDAFSYFGKRYGMQVIGLQGISTDAEISTNDIQQLVDLLVEKQIKAIFVESSIPKRSLQAVQQAAAARGWPIILGDELYSDALGNDDASTYIGMIKHNVRAIVNGLSS